MPQIINTSTKYFNQFKNGLAYTDNPSDFTQNFTGGVMEKTQCVIDISIEWFANADFVDEWNVDAVNNIITRTVGSFIVDGFNVGQKFRFISGWAFDNTTPNEFEATIDFIREDGLRIDFTVTSGAVTSTGPQDDVGIRALGNASENYLTGLVYQFGFVENSAATTFTSLVTGNNMGYQVGGIPRAAGNNQMSSVGNIKDWVTGNSVVEFVSESDYFQNFQVRHEYTIHPWYRDGELSDLQNNIPPNEFEGTNSLKHVFRLDFRQVLSNPNTSIISQVTDNLGSVGWFDENYNGIGDDYNVVSVSYEDTTSTNAVDSLQAALRTTVTIEIEKVSGAIVAGQKAGLFVSLLAPQSEYQDKTTTLLENYIYDGLYHVEGTGTTVGTGVIKSFTSSISAGNIIIVAELEYAASQQSTLASINEPFYVLGVSIANEALTNPTSDRLTLKADVKQYILGTDVSGLLAFDQFDIHFADSEIGVDTGVTNGIFWNEDSLAVEVDFTLERDVLKDAFLNTIDFALIAYNTVTEESFDLDNTSIDLSQVIVSGGIQQIEIDTTRNYLFDNTGVEKQYNEVSITTGPLVGTLQHYTGVFAQKIRWEDWINNLSADTIFFASGQPNDGLNFKSSNYSNLNDYEIRLAVRANVQGIDDLGQSRATDYIFLGNDLTVNDYNVGINYTCVIETFRNSNASNIGGSVLVGEDTLIRATFTNTGGPVTDLTGFWTKIGIQIDNDNGQQIEELSTTYIRNAALLKPKAGFSFLDMQIVGGNVVCECLVDGTKAQQLNYNISARIKSLDDECFVEFMNGDCAEFENGDLAKFLDQ